MSASNLSQSTKQLQVPLQDQSDDEDPEIDNNTTEDRSNSHIAIQNSDNDNNEHPQPQRIDTQALNGLRGIVAVHIMVFHSLLYSKLQWNILGSVQMPLFFLISGFIFGLSEGKQKYLPTKCCTELKKYPNSNPVNINDSEESSEDIPIHFDGRNYYQRRIARTIPLFYLINFLCIPLVFSGHGWVSDPITLIVALVYVIFACSTWFGQPTTLCGPSWFVSTIWFFYWCFPSLLPKLQRIPNDKKPKWIFKYFWIQLGVGVAIFIIMQFISPGLAFYVATFWPPSRLPVFIMGVIAGLLRSDGLGMRKSQNHWTQKKWIISANLNGGIMVALYVVLSVITIVWVDIGANIWVQLGYAYSQLEFIYALTFEGGESRVYKILTSRIALWLGRISYALYLIHEPFIQYICWIVYGNIKAPGCDYDDEDEDNPCNASWDEYNNKRLMPIWCIPILWIVSIIVAILLNRLIEEPMRKVLRPKR